MSVRCHLLILLIPVLSLCGATEYYVRPTEPTNTSCPAQPCLTFSQYVNDSDHYFKSNTETKFGSLVIVYVYRYFTSNTVFRFLPGTHHLDQPLVLRNVQNVSLENFYGSSNERPHIVAEFSCKDQAHPECMVLMMDSDAHGIMCCVAIQFHDSQNVSLKGISITIQTPGMSGVAFKNVSNINIQLITVRSIPMQPTGGWEIGILIGDCYMVEVYSSHTVNDTIGFMIQRTINIFVVNITATNCSDRGISFYGTTHATIIGPKAISNSAGMVINGAGKHITVIGATVVYNHDFGMDLEYTNYATIINPTVMFNGNEGIRMGYLHNISIINATLMQTNAYSGISMKWVTNVSIIDTTVHIAGDSDMSITSSYISILSSSHTSIVNSSFIGIGAAPSAASSADPSTHPAVIALYDSSLYLNECNFTGNSISAVKAYASNITAAGDLIFSSNKAIAGTAFILVQNSILRLAENCHVCFNNNYATNTGGVFYITNNEYYGTQSYRFSRLGHTFLQSTCFLNVEGKRSQVRLMFANNSAAKGGDILYGGHVALGLDGEYWNCLESFDNISIKSQKGLSLITSDPSRVCLCNETGQPDCLTLVDPTPHSIYPGQSFNLSAVVVGQQFGTVAGSVYAHFVQRSATVRSPQLETWQGSQEATQDKCNSLEFTIFSKSEKSDAVLALTASNKDVTQFWVKEYYTEEEVNSMTFLYRATAVDPIKYANNPVYVNILILSCPPGFMLTSEHPFRCDCNQLLQSLHGVNCHIQDQTIRRSGLVWVGTLKDDNETVAASEYCSFDYCNGGDSNVTLSEPDSQCNYNHSGTLCGGCQPGLSLALGSAQCLSCSNKYLALLIPFVLAGLALVFFIKLLDLTISQGTLNGLIFHSNIVKANEYIFIPHGHTNPLTLFIAWLNLDLGVETCFFHGLTAYTKTWLQFVFPLYIWSIAGLIIVIAKYSDRVAKVMGNNSVPVLATLFSSPMPSYFVPS